MVAGGLKAEGNLRPKFDLKRLVSYTLRLCAFLAAFAGSIRGPVGLSGSPSGSLGGDRILSI